MKPVRIYGKLARRLKRGHPLRRSIEALVPIEEELEELVRKWEALNERERAEFEKRRERSREWFEEQRRRLLRGS